MSLQEHVRQMTKALGVPGDQRDKDWAHGVCRTSRHIHEGVWECRPKRQFVRDELVPLLVEARQAVTDVPAAKRSKKLLEAFAGNIESRIRNLGNFVEGKPSAFAPGDVLEKAGASDLEPEALLDRLIGHD